MPNQTISDRLRTLPQYLLPQHLLSRLMFKLARWQGGSITHWIINRFIQYYQVDMSVAQLGHTEDYLNFNQFFTRELQPTARPIANAAIISPVDGEISQLGHIADQRLIQAKGHDYSLLELLGGDSTITNLFNNGLFCTIYLSPKNYHRVHAPVTGHLTDMIYVPGRLFSVNQRTARVVPNLFARNERLICLFDTKFGKLAVILVGAFFVGSMETVWAGTITPPYNCRQIQATHYVKETVPTLQQGSELGRFNMGSTVILLVEAQQVTWLSEYGAGTKVLMGQALTQELL